MNYERCIQNEKLREQESLQNIYGMRAMFGAFGINTTDCNLFCDLLHFHSPHDFVMFENKDMEIFEHKTRTHGPFRYINYEELQHNITRCFQAYQACRFDFESFRQTYL